MIEMVEILDGRLGKRSVERVRYVINNLLHLVIVKYGDISLVFCISTRLRLVTILSLLLKYLVTLHADPCNKSYIYIYYIGTCNGPIKLVRRGGIYFDVPPQCSIPDTAHGQWVRRYGYSSSLQRISYVIN